MQITNKRAQDLLGKKTYSRKQTDEKRLKQNQIRR